VLAVPVVPVAVAHPEVAAHLGAVVDSATVVAVVALSVVAVAPGVDSVTAVDSAAVAVAHPGVAAGAVTKLLARVLTSWKRTKMMHW
jgi:hypothetical protein